MPLQRASLNGKGIEGGAHRILLHKCTANKRYSTTNLKWRSVGTSFFFDKTLFGYLFNKWIIERCNWQTEQITSWNVWIFQYYNRWLRLNCLQCIWQRILTKRAAGARSKAKLQVLWPCCALVVLGTLGDSQFLVRGYRNVYVDMICVSVFFSSSRRGRGCEAAVGQTCHFVAARECCHIGKSCAWFPCPCDWWQTLRSSEGSLGCGLNRSLGIFFGWYWSQNREKDA